MYPTMQQVLRANRDKLRDWYKNLPSPQSDEENDILSLIYKRLS